MSLTVHGVWANLDHGHAMPLLDGLGFWPAGGFFGYYAMNRAKKVRDRKWTELHWKVGLASVVVATAGAWFALRFLEGELGVQRFVPTYITGKGLASRFLCAKRPLSPRPAAAEVSL